MKIMGKIGFNCQPFRCLSLLWFHGFILEFTWIYREIQHVFLFFPTLMSFFLRFLAKTQFSFSHHTLKSTTAVPRRKRIKPLNLPPQSSLSWNLLCRSRVRIYFTVPLRFVFLVNSFTDFPL